MKYREESMNMAKNRVFLKENKTNVNLQLLDL